MRTDLETLSSFDLIITTSIMQSDDESMSVSVNRNGHRGAVFDLPEIERAESPPLGHSLPVSRGSQPSPPRYCCYGRCCQVLQPERART